MTKYILIVFKDENEMDSNSEISVLGKVAEGDVYGASCGAINLVSFKSRRTKDEIASVLRNDGFNFMLMKDEDAEMEVPNYLSSVLGQTKPKFSKLEPKKLSLNEQLNEAVKNQDFEMAAILRDKITNPVKAVEKKVRKPRASKAKANIVEK